MTNYDDIIHLPHWEPHGRKRMSMESRAAQFAPFAALKEGETTKRHGCVHGGYLSVHERHGMTRNYSALRWSTKGITSTNYTNYSV